MTRNEFIDQLRRLGFGPEEVGNDYVTFPYMVPVGRFAGRQIKVGLLVKDLLPPPGPCICPPLLPLNPQPLPHPNGGIHDSASRPDWPLGAGWQYWSRPFTNWENTDRSARTYIARLTALFDFQ
jgi:hypothetical protein